MAICVTTKTRTKQMRPVLDKQPQTSSAAQARRTTRVAPEMRSAPAAAVTAGAAALRETERIVNSSTTVITQFCYVTWGGWVNVIYTVNYNII